VCAPSNNDEETSAVGRRSIAGLARVRRFGFPHTALGTRARLFAVETAKEKKIRRKHQGI
jgi:hypothetical protein